jgi:uncharacterized protein YacL (UPF0231 family)
MNEETKREWIRVLESLRFDVVRRDPLQAHKEYTATHVADVTLDASGSIRMTITRQTSDTKSEERRSRTGRAYKVFIEHNAIMIVNYQLNTEDDMRTVLEEMEKVGNRQ